VFEIKTKLSPDVQFERLQVQGIITENGEVTGKIHRWDSFLAITQTIPNSNSFRCVKIIFGSPRVFVDVPRTKLIEHILNEKKIITAYWDDRLKLWKEGSIVRLTTDDFIRIDSHDIKEDFLGV